MNKRSIGAVLAGLFSIIVVTTRKLHEAKAP
jgi:hypothetical protein